MKKILLADDETNVRLLVRTTLDAPDFQIIEAEDGQAAVNLARSQSPDLIILDWLMPKMTGLEVVSELRKKPQTANIPIIMLTCKGQPSDIALGKQAGVTTYLIKPFSPLSLYDLVQEILGLSLAK